MTQELENWISLSHSIVMAFKFNNLTLFTSLIFFSLLFNTKIGTLSWTQIHSHLPIYVFTASPVANQSLFVLKFPQIPLNGLKKKIVIATNSDQDREIHWRHFQKTLQTKKWDSNNSCSIKIHLFCYWDFLMNGIFNLDHCIK